MQGINFLNTYAAAAAKSLQLCPALCDPINGNQTGSPIHGVLQARILEWVVMPSSMGFPNPGTEPKSFPLQVDALLSEPLGKAKNTGVGSLYFLQGILPTQESN